MSVKLCFSDSAATGIGSLPHRDPSRACLDVLSCYPEIPYVPTLPNRSLCEQIIWNDAEFLPGRVIQGDRIFVDRDTDFTADMERVYLDFVSGDYEKYAVSPEYVSSLHQMALCDLTRAKVLKCQVNGPVTMGMQVVDNHRRPVGYDVQYADMLGKMLALRAKWYESWMQGTGVAETLVVFNEPYLTALGSSVMSIDREQVRAGWEDVTSLLTGSAGIHCCSNTDWEFLLSLEPAVLSFDAYANAKEFFLYKDAIVSFLEKGGVIAWGIVPAEWDVFVRETTDSLLARYLEIRSGFTELLSIDLFDSRALITPSCGIRSTDPAGATRIMKTAADISLRVRALSS